MSRFQATVVWGGSRLAVRRNPRSQNPVRFFDPADPAGPCYAVAALGDRDPANPDRWTCGKAELIPLTAAAVRKEAENPARPLDWRAQFLTWADRLVAEVRSLLAHHDQATQGAFSRGAAAIEGNGLGTGGVAMSEPAAAGDSAAKARKSRT